MTPQDRTNQDRIEHAEDMAARKWRGDEIMAAYMDESETITDTATVVRRIVRAVMESRSDGRDATPRDLVYDAALSGYLAGLAYGERLFDGLTRARDREPKNV